jgi:hypothetical protein
MERFQPQPGETILEPDTWAGRLVRAVWHIILQIVPHPEFLNPYLEALVLWYTRITDAATQPGGYSDYLFWAKRANRRLMDDLASALGQTLATFIKENP